MKVELIVGEIDAEIEKLQRMRAIVAELLEPKPRAVAKPRPVRAKRVVQIEIKAEPRVVVLPPKQRREYARQVKPIVAERKALAAPMSNLPVFVPKAAVTELSPAKVTGFENGMEAVMRRKLLEGLA